jgi:hypothetical protein
MSTMQMDAVTRNGFLLVHGSGTCDDVCRRMQRLAPAGGATFDSTRDRSWVRQRLSQDGSECFGELDGPGFNFEPPMCHAPRDPVHGLHPGRLVVGVLCPADLPAWLLRAQTPCLLVSSDPSAEPRHQPGGWWPREGRRPSRPSRVPQVPLIPGRGVRRGPWGKLGSVSPNVRCGAPPTFGLAPRVQCYSTHLLQATRMHPAAAFVIAADGC